MTVKIEARDETTVSDSTKLWPGFGVYPLTDDFKKQLKLKDQAFKLERAMQMLAALSPEPAPDQDDFRITL